MHMVRGEGESTDTNGVELLRPAESAEDDLVELVAGGEEIAALDGPAGDLDEATPVGRQIADASAHAGEGRNKSGDLPDEVGLFLARRRFARKRRLPTPPSSRALRPLRPSGGTYRWVFGSGRC